VQIALALMLLAGAGLIGRSFVRLLEQDPGFETENVVGFTTQAWRFYPSAAQRAGFVRVATEALEAAPGVVAAGMTSSLPLAGQIYADRATFTVVGQAEPRPGQEPSARGAAVTTGYFAALGIPLQAGRLFDSTDDADAPAVVVVSEALERRHFPEGNAVGARLRLSFAGPPMPAEVIGVVGDVRHAGLDDPVAPALYLPHAQHPTGAITFTVRTAAPIATALATLKQRIWDLNPRVALTDTGTLQGLLSDTLRARRFYLVLLGVFSVVALFLAVIGIYGLISYAVRRRISEVGIRLALGAQAPAILRLFLSRAGALALAGTGAGLAGSLLLTRTLRSLLFEIRPTDPLTLVGVSVLLAGVALAATWVPARRASRLDPAQTLRAE
jgi:predicted permease